MTASLAHDARQCRGLLNPVRAAHLPVTARVEVLIRSHASAYVAAEVRDPNRRLITYVVANFRAAERTPSTPPEGE